MYNKRNSYDCQEKVDSNQSISQSNQSFYIFISFFFFFKIVFKGLSDAKVDKIKEVANKISTDTGFLTALQLSEKRKSIFKLCTGSQELKSLFILIFLFILFNIYSNDLILKALNI